jgi:hypothetical protein
VFTLSFKRLYLFWYVPYSVHYLHAINALQLCWRNIAQWSPTCCGHSCGGGEKNSTNIIKIGLNHATVLNCGVTRHILIVCVILFSPPWSKVTWVADTYWRPLCNKITSTVPMFICCYFNPLTPDDLLRRHAVIPLKIKIPSKHMRENPTRTTPQDTTRPSTIFYRLLLNWASLRRH